VRVPWTTQRWALPFLCVLATTPDVSQQLGLRHKTIGRWAHQLVSLLRRWLPGVPIKLLGSPLVIAAMPWVIRRLLGRPLRRR
jgi:hypothetical protein